MKTRLKQLWDGAKLGLQLLALLLVLLGPMIWGGSWPLSPTGISLSGGDNGMSLGSELLRVDLATLAGAEVLELAPHIPVKRRQIRLEWDGDVSEESYRTGQLREVAAQKSDWLLEEVYSLHLKSKEEKPIALIRSDEGHVLGTGFVELSKGKNAFVLRFRERAQQQIFERFLVLSYE